VSEDVPEISDLVVSYDPETLARIPVKKSEVLARFEALGQRRARQVVAALPARDDVLDPTAVDEVLLRAHGELQRLSEEFQQGRRILEVLRPMLDALRATGAKPPYRVVDVGCGVGYVVRWLAAVGELGDDVELLGYDFNEALVAEGDRLQRLESLDCAIRVGNAFRLDRDEAPTIYLSTGVLHHFRGAGLVAFFRNQAHAEAFFHFDIDPSWLAPIGAWLFHRARMREPLARNDGVRSALRGHTGAALLAAAREGAPELRATLFRVGNKVLPITRTLRPVVGVRPGRWDAWCDALGRRRRLIREQP